MRQKLDMPTVLNRHDSLSGHYQHRGTSSITTGNLIEMRAELGSYSSGLYIWLWKKFRGRGEDYLRIVTFYRTVPPTAGGGPVLVYAQHMTYVSNLGIRELPRIDFLLYLVEDIKTWKNKGYQIILMGDIKK